MSKDERMDATILGRNIGTFSGWDEIEINSFVMYNFVPRGIDLPAGDISIFYDEGKFRAYDDDGNITFESDILMTMMKLERA